HARGRCRAPTGSMAAGRRGNREGHRGSVRAPRRRGKLPRGAVGARRRDAPRVLLRLPGRNHLGRDRADPQALSRAGWMSRVSYETLLTSAAAGVARIEVAALVLVGLSDDAKEGIAAFFEK